MMDQDHMKIPQNKEERIEKLKKLLFVKKGLEESIVKNIDKRDNISGAKKDLVDKKDDLLDNNMVELINKFKKCKTDKDFRKEAAKVIKKIQKISDDEEKKRQTATMGKLNILFKEFLKSNEKNTRNDDGFGMYIQEKIDNLKGRLIILEDQITAMDSREDETRNFISEKNKEINEYLDNFRKGGLYENELEGLDLSGQNLMDLDFSNLNLRGAKLVGSMLFMANFNYSDLSGSNLSQTYAPKSKFEETNLKDVTFNTEVNLDNINNLIPDSARDKKETVITGANLKKVNLDGVNLDGVNLEQSIMEEVSLVGTVFTKNTNLFATKLCKSNLDNADFSGAKFDKTVIDDNQKVLLEKKEINTEKCLIRAIEVTKQSMYPTESIIEKTIKNNEKEQGLSFAEKLKLYQQRTQDCVGNNSIQFHD